MDPREMEIELHHLLKKTLAKYKQDGENKKNRFRYRLTKVLLSIRNSVAQCGKNKNVCSNGKFQKSDWKKKGEWLK